MRRFFSTSLRAFNQAASQASSSSSTATQRLPRLTLFTGGPECSLCDMFKQDLEVVRYTHPFELETFNIHDPPATIDPEKALEIRRKYLYDIPVLHIDDHYLQKHRINSTVLKQTIETYDPMDPEPRYSLNVFKADVRPEFVMYKEKKRRIKRAKKEEDRQKRRAEARANGEEGEGKD